jgi:hypothetical protein
MALSAMFEGYRWTFLAVAGIALIIAGNLLVMGNPLKALRKAGGLQEQRSDGGSSQEERKG